MVEWRDVVGYEGLYEVSDDGSVRSLDRVIIYEGDNRRVAGARKYKGKVRRAGLDRYGYPKLTLTSDSVLKNFTVHRLVAEAFIPNPDNLPTVNHIDEDKTNNNVSNLEWMTVQDNTRHSAKLSVAIVQSIMFDFYYGLTNVEIAERLNIPHKNISGVRNGRTWSSITGIQRS